MLVCDQRVAASKLWGRVTEEDLKRLDGSCDGNRLPTIREVMKSDQVTRTEVWGMGRAGKYIAYRIARGHTWEWRLQGANGKEQSVLTSGGNAAPIATEPNDHQGRGLAAGHICRHLWGLSEEQNGSSCCGSLEEQN